MNKIPGAAPQFHCYETFNNHMQIQDPHSLHLFRNKSKQILYFSVKQQQHLN